MLSRYLAADPILNTAKKLQWQAIIVLDGLVSDNHSNQRTYKLYLLIEVDQLEDKLSWAGPSSASIEIEVETQWYLKLLTHIKD